MPTLDSPEMMRAVIMDHYEYPRNKRVSNNDKYQKDIPFKCEVYIAKEKWTDDGSHYIGADIMKFENLK